MERACPDSVVEIDKETVKYNLRGKVKEKECFRRVFVSYKACWSGFLNGCRPYLAVDATALNGRFRGQLAAACAIDAHNWLFPVAYGVLETIRRELDLVSTELASGDWVSGWVGHTHGCL